MVCLLENMSCILPNFIPLSLTCSANSRLIKLDPSTLTTSMDCYCRHLKAQSLPGLWVSPA